MSDLTDAALAFAIHAHQFQRRKYTGHPYIIHPVAVANLVASVGGTEEMIAAAYLHDVVEDCGIIHPVIAELFGPRVDQYVKDLTNVTLAAGNRRAREYLNLRRFEAASNESKTIKLADLIDNTNTIVKYDPDFAPLYLEEKRKMLEVLKGGNQHLMAMALALAYRSETIPPDAAVNSVA